MRFASASAAGTERSFYIYSFNFLMKHLSIVIPRLTRRPVSEADIQKFFRPPLMPAAFCRWTWGDEVADSQMKLSDYKGWAAA